MDVLDNINVIACLGSNMLVGDLGGVTGPFFLGFTMECFAMGIVTVLGADYLVSVASRRKLPAESPRRLGVALVILTLVLTSSQTIVNLYRGYRIFGTHFMNISKFLSPDPLWFISPFLGILSGFITQLFLLRRIVRFVSSLDLLWPFLSRNVIKYGFTTCMVLAILVVAIEGTMASAMVMKSGGLANLGLGLGKEPTQFQKRSAVWLGAAVAVDCVLCSVLCVELWWARRKLAMSGTTMQNFISRLILITFHGGAAVTGLQVTTLLLYYYAKYSSWCYFPMILLPKVYSITLILSISLPQYTAAQAHSQVISLPTISPSQDEYRRASSPAICPTTLQPPLNTHPSPLQDPHIHVERPAWGGDVEEKDEKAKVKTATRSAPAYGTRWSDVLRTSWRRSQGLLSWSLMPEVGQSGQEMKEQDKGKWLKQIDGDLMVPPQTPRPASAPESRRPSLMPLLDTPSPQTPSDRLPSSFSLQTNAPSLISPLTRCTTAPPPRNYNPSTASSLSTFRSRNDSFSLPHPISGPHDYSSSPPEISVHRQQSFTYWSPTSRQPRRSTDPSPGDRQSLKEEPAYILPLPPVVQTPGLDFHFDTINPFDSIYSSSSQLSLPQHPPAPYSQPYAQPSGSQLPLMPYAQGDSIQWQIPSTASRRTSRERDIGDGSDETHRPAGRGRMLSFQDFLAGGAEERPDPGGRKGSGMSEGKRRR